jgi:hypothetical protein
MNLGYLDMKKDQWSMLSNPNCMLLEAEVEEGLILMEEEVDFLVESTTELNQCLRRSPNKIFLI